MSRYIKAEIVDNQSIYAQFKLLTLSPEYSIDMPLPGQFYMLGLSSDFLLLKRPFSHFRRSINGDIQILYKIVGKGTSILGSLGRGALVELLGPLGNSYPSPENSAIIVAGGIGIASLYSLIETLNKPVVFYGARSSGELLFLDEIKNLSEKVFISTEDGSAGEKGLITESLKRYLSTIGGDITIYACGPSGMLRTVSTVARERGYVAYLSVEERMACGIGACFGCVIKTTEGYKRVCKEGPVFRSDEIIW